MFAAGALGAGYENMSILSISFAGGASTLFVSVSFSSSSQSKKSLFMTVADVITPLSCSDDTASFCAEPINRAGLGASGQSEYKLSTAASPSLHSCSSLGIRTSLKSCS